MIFCKSFRVFVIENGDRGGDQDFICLKRAAVRERDGDAVGLSIDAGDPRVQDYVSSDAWIDELFEKAVPGRIEELHFGICVPKCVHVSQLAIVPELIGLRSVLECFNAQIRFALTDYLSEDRWLVVYPLSAKINRDV